MAFAKRNLPTPCAGCPNQKPEELPGNAVFNEVYRVAQHFRLDGGQLDYSATMQLMRDMAIPPDDRVRTVDKIKEVESQLLKHRKAEAERKAKKAKKDLPQEPTAPQQPAPPRRIGGGNH